MKKNRRKKRVKLKVSGLIFLIIIIGVVFFVYKYIFKDNPVIITYKNKYLASDTNVVELFSYNKDVDELEKKGELIRGTKVKVLVNNKLYKDDINYVLVKNSDGDYYVKENNIVDDEEDVVLEKNRFVRTSVTVYKNEKDSKIESFIKKGNELTIIGYDNLDDNGNVNMYNISFGDIKGWVYSKYLVSTKELATAVYNENNVYDTHAGRRYSRELYGGIPENLDYYPYEKPNFEGNSLLKEAKTMYLNGTTISSIDSYLNIATSSGVNAIVVDIKDGALAYESEVAKEYSMTAYETHLNSFTDYQNAIKKIKDAGIYVIGRIVVFNDTHYGKDHPEDCITSTVSNRLWPSAYSRGAWEYNVELAKEAVQKMGFNEIQFDYVRFPEDSYNMTINGNSDFKNKYEEEKAEAVQNFLFYAVDQIHKEGAYLSVDVFGECSSEYVTSYGQYWPAISNIVDVISSMPYTDHFDRNPERWTNPYQTMYNWAKGAVQRQNEIPTPAIARTWITAYDTPYWNPTTIYDASKINDQVKALYDAGLTGGFITWNSKSSLAKYEQIKSAFSKEYS